MECEGHDEAKDDTKRNLGFAFATGGHHEVVPLVPDTLMTVSLDISVNIRLGSSEYCTGQCWDPVRIPEKSPELSQF